MLARRALVGEPRDACCDRSADADRRVEPELTSFRLASIPDGDNLLRVCDRLALGLSTFGIGHSAGGEGQRTSAVSTRPRVSGSSNAAQIRMP